MTDWAAVYEKVGRLYRPSGQDGPGREEIQWACRMAAAVREAGARPPDEVDAFKSGQVVFGWRSPSGPDTCTASYGPRSGVALTRDASGKTVFYGLSWDPVQGPAQGVPQEILAQEKA